MSGLSDWRVMPAVALLAVLGLAGCEQKQQQDHAASTAPKEVEAIAVKAESFTVVDELPGRIEPVRVAQVRARVAGIVLTRNFEEGADVKAGAVLFQIDPAPFKAALSKAQGDLARTEATLFETQATVKHHPAGNHPATRPGLRRLHPAGCRRLANARGHSGRSPAQGWRRRAVAERRRY
ncbi:Multidrug resistance protein AcrA/AcrE family [Pseudomonas savastanoi pv. phaseolicola]|nr:Multidrug resistance protein AcrA/AcrE family [Pseudomonas savastanoi pv. phaseolicola]